jgi:osmoprotectant transport system permease protein
MLAEPNRKPAGMRRADRLGALLTLIGGVAVTLQPFVLFKANRIVPGEPRALLDVLPPWTTGGFYVVLALAAVTGLFVTNPRARLGVALAALVVVALTVAAAASALTPPGNQVVRVAAGGAFWLVALALGLLATDALTRLQPGPLLRVLWLGAFLAAVSAALATGFFDDLSVMREYAVNATRFAREVRQHLLLATGSLAAAVVIALPLGVVCHRHPRLRAPVLGALNVIQTIPSIALFGILMAPLAAVALAVPALAALGISGIGAAPAAIALFLYSLLPIVGNTVVGLARVSPPAVDAARGMGLTDRQILRQIELPLALPTILTGIRIVLVQNIGMVTIAALIGGGGLGAFVFQGIGQTAIDLVLLGAIPTVVLAFSAAVVLDAVTDLLTRKVAQ